MKLLLTKNLFSFLFLLTLVLPLTALDESGPVATATFDLNACTAYNYDKSYSDYSEFTATIVNSNEATLSVVGNNLYRLNPVANVHSCTPGLNGTEAMCISYDSSCDYVPGSQRSVRFDINVTPQTATPVQVLDRWHVWGKQLSIILWCPYFEKWRCRLRKRRSPDQYGMVFTRI